MARPARNLRLQTKEARKRLPEAHEPYWHELRRGLHVGFRQGANGGTWWLREYRDGKIHKRRIGIADSDTTAADGVSVFTWEDVTKHANEPQRATTKPAGHYTVRKALKAYFDHRAAKSPAESVETDRTKAEGQIVPKLGDESLDGLTTGKLLEWRDGLVAATDDPEAKRRAQATANRLWTILRAALNHAYATQHVASADAWRRIRPFDDVDRPGDRFLSEAECKRLLNACSPLFRNLVRGALYTGCRLGELVRLTAADVDGSSVIIRHSKSGKQRRVPLSGEGETFFDQITAGKAGDVLLFPDPDGSAWPRIVVSRAMKAATDAAEIKPAVTFRDLRRTYGSLLINKGTAGAIIQRLLGHADQRMTQRVYAHMLDKTLESAVRKKSPKFGLRATNVRKLKP